MKISSLIVLILMLSACGPESYTDTFQKWNGYWQTHVRIQPVTFDSTRPVPTPYTYDTVTQIIANDGLRQMRMTNLCQVGEDVVLAGSTTTPYWHGEARPCVSVTLPECNPGSFALYTLTLRQDGDGVAGDGAGELKGDGSGELQRCGFKENVLFYVNATRMD
jgi:hypothetical protein